MGQTLEHARRASGATDPALDLFMPTYEVAERHETRVHAPALVTWDAARALDLHRSPVVRAIFAARELVLGSKPAPPRASGTFLQEVLDLGWGVLAEEPGRELVLGAVTKPWEPDVRFRRLAPDAFAAFQDPGYAQIAWTLVVEPVGTDRSVFRTETGVATTDAASRRRFRRYWFVFSPGIRVIRWEALRLVRGAAERRVTQG